MTDALAARALEPGVEDVDVDVDVDVDIDDVVDVDVDVDVDADVDINYDAKTVKTGKNGAAFA